MRKIIAALAIAAAPLSAQAQEPAGEAELRALQAEQFKAMFDDPANLDLMFEYALTSIRLKDYEAAITTLDRMLIFNPRLPRVRLELAASYFRIGSYPVAAAYFEEVLEDPDADETLRARAREFLDEIERRTRTSRFAGVISIGALFSTNANSGPDTREIIFFDTTAQLTGADVTAQTDFGGFLSAQISHEYDLGGADADVWRSELAFYGQRYHDTRNGAADVLVARSGPRLSLDEERYGLKARPYAELEYVRSANDPLYYTIGAGLEITDTLRPGLTADADMRLGWRDYQDGTGTDKDGVNLRARAGLTRFPDDDSTLRGRLLFEYDGAEDRSERSVEIGAEAVYSLRYESGFDFAARKWLAAAGARGVVRFFDEPSVTVPGQTREDIDLRLTLSNTAYLENGLGAQLRAEYFIRDSNIRNFDFDGLTISAGLMMTF